jgi:hypothetical protein
LDCGGQAAAPLPAFFEMSEISSGVGPAGLKSGGKASHSKVDASSAAPVFI